MTAVETAHTLRLENSYANLPEVFYARVAPTPVPDPKLIRINRPLAQQLGLDYNMLAAPDGVAVLAGNHVPDGAKPLAMAYAGHQFGNFVPSLGDGRAVLLGELVDGDGMRRDVQLKGAGRTPFSRMGDGRAVLGPVLREYIVSEAMAGLGVPTTRALAMVSTGETLVRETTQPGAILTRVAASHVRVGTFEYFHRRGDDASMRTLADYVVNRNYPALAAAENPYAALLDAVCERVGKLMAQWLLVGFVHGVMNTDNASIVGETIDYGPCAFMDSYRPDAVYSSIDHAGRYAYNQQPAVGHWNLIQLAECLVPLLAENDEQAIERAKASLVVYRTAFETAYNDGLAAKIGLTQRRESDEELVADLLHGMADQQADFTLVFRRLSELAGSDAGSDAAVRTLFQDPSVFDAWAKRWRARLSEQGGSDQQRQAAMRTVNPAYVPRNHRVQQVIEAAEEGDWRPLDELLTVVAAPFEDHPELVAYAQPPRPQEVVQRTYCGT